MVDAGFEVATCGEAAKKGMRTLATADDAVINRALREMARLLTTGAPTVLAANAADVAAGESAGLGRGLLDRLRLDDARITQMATQIELLASVAFPAAAVRLNDLIPLVILRGSGDTTRKLAAEAAACGVRTLAHADGGGVLYIDRSARVDDAARLVADSLDRLGVCNRLNLLLICPAVWDEMLPEVTRVLDKLGIKTSLPPHDHLRGHEWALDPGHEATVTIDTAAGPAEAAEVANAETSGLGAGIVTTDPEAARLFLDTCRGTGAFWNASTRLLDGFKLRGVPETGINVDHVPGPRGPVTFEDLFLRQYVVVPGDAAG